MIIFIVLRSYNRSLGKVTEEEQDGINALKNRSGPPHPQSVCRSQLPGESLKSTKKRWKQPQHPECQTSSMRTVVLLTSAIFPLLYFLFFLSALPWRLLWSRAVENSHLPSCVPSLEVLVNISTGEASLLPGCLRCQGLNKSNLLCFSHQAAKWQMCLIYDGFMTWPPSSVWPPVVLLCAPDTEFLGLLVTMFKAEFKLRHQMFSWPKILVIDLSL